MQKNTTKKETLSLEETKNIRGGVDLGPVTQVATSILTGIGGAFAAIENAVISASKVKS
ncbi:hypothetical protein [Spartinivicinus ruber]|uniref:hypothetical protein n=1 Tax=Spartinivicinus ruber TaxID=2683272 RepID=UPI0013D34B0A|nr:hypothetical protein [Spartinivicinus ruber]